MQRRPRTPAVAALLAAALTACTGSSDAVTARTPSRAIPAPAPPSAQPGRTDAARALRRRRPGTLGPAACPALRQSSPDGRPAARQAVRGRADATYDTDRKVGCRWKAQSTDGHATTSASTSSASSRTTTPSATTSRRRSSSRRRRRRPDLPEPTPLRRLPTTDGDAEAEDEPRTPPRRNGESGRGRRRGRPVTPASDILRTDAEATSERTPPPPAGPRRPLQPRILDDLGDEAFLDDELNSSVTPAAHGDCGLPHANVIVTIEYDEQPTTTTTSRTARNCRTGPGTGRAARRGVRRLSGRRGPVELGVNRKPHRTRNRVPWPLDPIDRRHHERVMSEGTMHATRTATASATAPASSSARPSSR